MCLGKYLNHNKDEENEQFSPFQTSKDNLLQKSTSTVGTTKSTT